MSELKKILVTGTLGFIGYHLTRRLLEEGHTVVGIDNINSYYDVRQKYAKLPELGIGQEGVWENVQYISHRFPGFTFYKMDITDRYSLEKLFEQEQFDLVCNLAAQAGVQYSIKNPHTYISNNVTGFINIIDACRAFDVKHLVYASSSSVYGNRKDVPFRESDPVDQPISLYAASKKSNELIAHTYSHLYGLKCTGLRFFTVYGPWGRPDMAPFIFVNRIMKGEQIKVFNNGHMQRDFTYVADIIEGMMRVIEGGNNKSDYKIYNIGHAGPVNLMDFIRVIEKVLGKKADIKFMPTRPGDVEKTWADVTGLENDFGYRPQIGIEEGIRAFVDWKIQYDRMIK